MRITIYQYLNSTFGHHIHELSSNFIVVAKANDVPILVWYQSKVILFKLKLFGSR